MLLLRRQNHSSVYAVGLSSCTSGTEWSVSL